MKESIEYRVVVDTNIFISFLIGKILRDLPKYLHSKAIELVVSDGHINELSTIKKMRLYMLLIIAGFILGCSDADSGHYQMDDAFVLLTDSISPSGQFRYYEYQFDHGGYGYSRVFWAVTANTEEVLNLKEYNLPDGYRIIGWAGLNELQIEKWKPYYHIEEEVELKDGSIFKNVKLRLNK